MCVGVFHFYLNFLNSAEESQATHISVIVKRHSDSSGIMAPGIHDLHLLTCYINLRTLTICWDHLCDRWLRKEILLCGIL